MARPQRIAYEGAVYHVTARGNERRAIFRDDADHERFLRVLGESVTQFEVRLYLFCLRSNHLHLVAETPRANLGPFMHRLLTAYTVYFNQRHARCGHLLQGRYGARLEGAGGHPYRVPVNNKNTFSGPKSVAARKTPAAYRFGSAVCCLAA